MYRDSLTGFPRLHACFLSPELSSRHDSAGTHGHHLDEPADPRTLRASALRAYERQSLQDFDLILAIDKTHPDNLRRIVLPGQQKKPQLLMDYSANFGDDEVPDPCYGPGRIFDLEIDMIEVAQGKAAQ
ncbi:MAG TPA: low molecular weight phosphotyrosine protein phosphatase [Aromatoleum sp.]|uniref:arsenate reductase/protein-tyrosine-phosphatase family protein n=1 Tax=Aromatoleum sp. TaxID=2307007 RepID=UPI002B49BFA5|nr:low molecular weight phosphotyrosine protein phosphatase [Aromatoleum sp.]HJV25061.1 low molecular weight phosphotyrosine protein phosphatase [Aromatoleum sp.]